MPTLYPLHASSDVTSRTPQASEQMQGLMSPCSSYWDGGFSLPPQNSSSMARQVSPFVASFGPLARPMSPSADYFNDGSVPFRGAGLPTFEPNTFNTFGMPPVPEATIRWEGRRRVEIIPHTNIF